METKVFSRLEWLEVSEQLPMNVITVSLLLGDRMSCCDEAVVIMDGDELITVATIAPEGEMSSGEPTIVGVYVMTPYRGQGHGKTVLEAAIRRCIERGFEKTRIDVMSTKLMKIIEHLSDDLKSALRVIDLGGYLDLLPE